MSEVKLKLSDRILIDADELMQQVVAAGVTPTTYLSFHGQSAPTPFVRGLSHLLSTYAKTGATERLFKLVIEWSSKGHKILYLTTESGKVWEKRLSKLPTSDFEAFGSVRLGFIFGVPQTEITKWVADSTDDIVIVDNINQLGFSVANIRSYGDVEVAEAIDAIISECRLTSKTSIFVSALHDGKFESKFDIVLGDVGV